MGNKKRILLAEPDKETAVLLGKAFKERGVEVLYAKDGPTALRRAVEDLPDIIVTDIQLPLLNAVKIAQILKSNPKTKGLPFVFLSSGDINPAYLPFFQDSIVKKPFNVEEVVTRVDASFMKKEKATEVQSETKEIEGNLAQMSLVDILQIFGMNKKSGVLVVRREETFEEGMVFLREGKILNATTGGASGEKAVYRLLTWDSGKFEYIPKDFNPDALIGKPTDSLLMEGMRQLDEWKRMEREFPPMDSTIALKIDPSRIPRNLRPLTKEVISLLSYYKNVRGILDYSSYPDYEVMMTINTLVSKGVLDLSTDKPADDKKETPLLTSDEAFAIKDFLKITSREGRDMDVVKIPVFCNQADHLKMLMDILSTVNGFAFASEFSTASKGKNRFGELGRIKASDNITLLFILFPIDFSSAPLWPALMGDSVGAIMLRDGNNDELNMDLLHCIKETMNIDTALINMKQDINLPGKRGKFQMTIEEAEAKGADSLVRAILDSFLRIA
ncbi:MAG: DUF4388 domain-containing protein [bacterium]|nr:DUF4388 domain-containing protein [bacterium]